MLNRPEKPSITRAPVGELELDAAAADEDLRGRRFSCLRNSVIGWMTWRDRARESDRCRSASPPRGPPRAPAVADGGTPSIKARRSRGIWRAPWRDSGSPGGACWWPPPAASTPACSRTCWRRAAATPHRLAVGHVNHGLRGAEADADAAAVARWPRARPAGAGRRADPRPRRAGRLEPRAPDPPGGRARGPLRGAARARGRARGGADRHRPPRRRPGRDRAPAPAARQRTGWPRRHPRALARRRDRAAAARGEPSRARGLRRGAAASSGARTPRTRSRITRATGCGCAGSRASRANSTRDCSGPSADLAEAQRRDAEWIDAQVEREVASRFAMDGTWLRIDAKDWAELPEALARRVARAALRRCGAGREVSRAHLDAHAGLPAHGPARHAHRAARRSGLAVRAGGLPAGAARACAARGVGRRGRVLSCPLTVGFGPRGGDAAVAAPRIGAPLRGCG